MCSNRTSLIIKKFLVQFGDRLHKKHDIVIFYWIINNDSSFFCIKIQQHSVITEIKDAQSYYIVS